MHPAAPFQRNSLTPKPRLDNPICFRATARLTPKMASTWFSELKNAPHSHCDRPGVLLDNNCHGQDNAAELANKLSNPVADLISIPFFSSTTMTASVPPRMVHNITLNLQPVIPFTLNEDWNLISRTILPIVYQEDVFPDAIAVSREGATDHRQMRKTGRATALVERIRRRRSRGRRLDRRAASMGSGRTRPRQCGAWQTRVP